MKVLNPLSFWERARVRVTALIFLLALSLPASTYFARNAGKTVVKVVVVE